MIKLALIINIGLLKAKSEIDSVIIFGLEYKTIGITLSYKRYSRLNRHEY